VLEVVAERGNELNLEWVSRPLDVDPRPEFAGLYQQFLGSLSRQRLDDTRRREFEKAFGEPVTVALLGPWLEQPIVHEALYQRVAFDGVHSEVSAQAPAADVCGLLRQAGDSSQHPLGGGAQVEGAHAEVQTLRDQRAFSHTE